MNSAETHSNALSQHFRVTRADASTIIRILNTLQDNGVISDNVVSVDDIAHVDALRALQWLQSNGYAH